MQTRPYPRTPFARLVLAGLLVCMAGNVCQAAAPPESEPSLLDKAIDGTVHAVKAIDAAVSRAADKTGEWLRNRQVPNKVAHVVERTDAALHRAAGKIAPKDAPPAPPKEPAR
jgi:hypothetical protein